MEHLNMEHPMRAVRLIAFLTIATSVAVQGCSGHQAPPPESRPPAGPEGERSAPRGGLGLRGHPPSAQIGDQVVLTHTISSLDELLGRGLGYVRPHLPAPFAAMLQPAMLKTQWFKVLGVPQLAEAVDGGRPWALAVADPEAYPGGGKLKSLLVALPITDRHAFVDAMGQAAEQHEQTAWGDHVFNFYGGAVRVRFAEGFALLAAHQKLLNGAASVLLPLLKAPQTASRAARVRLDLATINRLYGAKLDKGLRRAQRSMAGKKTSWGPVSQMMTRWVGYLRSIDDVELELELEASGLRAVAEIRAAKSGEFPGYLSRLQPRSPWGARFMPKDSAVVMVQSQRSEEMLRGVDETADLLGAALGAVVPGPALTELRDLARGTIKHMSGESAGSVWVNADASLGVALAARMRDAAAGRAMAVKLLQGVSRVLKQVLTRGLPPHVREQLKGASVRLRVRKGALRVAGARGDLVQVDLRWPRVKGALARKELALTRKRLRTLLGRRPTLGLLAVKDALLIAMGKDHKKRLARMAAIAGGGAGTGMEQVIKQVAGDRPVIALVHARAASLVEQAMRLIETLAEVPPQAKAVLQKALPPPGTPVPVNAVVQVGSGKMTVEFDVSPEVVAMITRATVAGLTAARRGP